MSACLNCGNEYTGIVDKKGYVQCCLYPRDKPKVPIPQDERIADLEIEVRKWKTIADKLKIIEEKREAHERDLESRANLAEQLLKEAEGKIIGLRGRLAKHCQKWKFKEMGLDSCPTCGVKGRL